MRSVSRPRGGDDTGEALTPHPSHAVFFYLGAGVGISWMAWQAWNAGPFAFIAEAAREVQLEMEPPDPVRLGVPASLEAGQAMQRTPAQTWWMPSTREAVERTLCLVGIRADRPLPDRSARRRMDGVRRHEWALEDEVPVAFDPVGTCGMAEAGPWMPMPALPR